ncbi:MULTISPECIES: hypothetical protein [unclassified Xanthomonas]|uniref:hypothetical protein n=1 Tax=unclassified Xanthomonas TaxID=2643310 RepID=UPI002A7EEAF9|nr:MULTISPECIES: hypothetical protein [unclassified Xanthomonas]MDY4295830.1 hypothetical protein [Xanthomonas sp. LF02-5]MDY4357625.1 hypothetical protein [Xanthomonas sp. LF04-12]
MYAALRVFPRRGCRAEGTPVNQLQQQQQQQEQEPEQEQEQEQEQSRLHPVVRRDTRSPTANRALIPHIALRPQAMAAKASDTKNPAEAGVFCAA